MRLAGGILLALSVTAASLFAAVNPAMGHKQGGKEHPRVFTDGRLRPGHFETMRVTGFPGKGDTEVLFFPGAICEDECSVRSFKGGRTNAEGAARFRVHVPQTFVDEHGRSAYFRDGERIEVLVTWEGPDDSFGVAEAEPEPVIVRVHGSHHG